LNPFLHLLRNNRNYRYTWLGQTVSEIGDHFNSIAVLSLALHLSGSGATVGAVMIARVVPALLAGPVAGVVLDRMDRRKVMLASDIARGIIALAHVLLLTYRSEWLLYLLSGMLMFASPFFNAGRSAILPKITDKDELHTANALTQTTSWLTVALGTMFGGLSAATLGYQWAFVFNAVSFACSTLAIWSLQAPRGHFRPERGKRITHEDSHWREFRDGLAYMKREPLVLGISMLAVGWATGGGAAQILFTLFGEQVFQRGPAGTGTLWGSAGFGLVLGGIIGHKWGTKLPFVSYKRTVTVSFLLHGLAYAAFSLSGTFYLAMFWIFVSRAAVAVNSVLSRTMLLTHVPDGYRGRVFTTYETMLNGTMLISMGACAVAAAQHTPREIGFVAGILSASTGIFWAWADAAGKLVEPGSVPEPEETPESRITPA
jgi:MFS family permease